MERRSPDPSNTDKNTEQGAEQHERDVHTPDLSKASVNKPGGKQDFQKTTGDGLQDPQQSSTKQGDADLQRGGRDR